MSRLTDMSLQWKMGLFGLAGLLCIAGLSGLLGTLLAQEGSQRMIEEQLAIAQIVASVLDHEVEEQFQELARFDVGADGAFGSHASQQHLLQDLLRRLEPFVTEVYLVDASGRVVWTEPPDPDDIGQDRADRPEIREPLTTGARYASGVHEDEDGQPRLILSLPVWGADGRPTGVVGAALHPSHVFQVLVTVARQLGESRHVEVIDQQARIVTSSRPGDVLRPAGNEEFYGPLLERRARGVGTIRLMEAGNPEDPGQRHVMAFVPLASVPWGLSLGAAESEFTALADRWRWQTVPLAGLALILALGLVWTMARSVVGPVSALTRVSRRIASGDLATPVARLGHGEVGVLAEALDDMRGRLHEALDALAWEKSRYQGIVESMAEAVFTVDANDLVTSFNPAAETLTGWNAQEVLGRPCWEVVQRAGGQDEPASPASYPFLPCYRLPNAPESASALAEVEIRRRDGRWMAVAPTRSVIRSRDGVVQGTVYVLRDVSAARELSRLKDEFLSTVSHELRTPLGFIKGYAATLLAPDAPLDEETTRRCLWVIVEASDQLESLVDQLLDLSKIRAGALTIQPQPVRLKPLAREAVERTHVRLAGHRMQMHVPARLPLVLADPHRIEQVLYNLLDNAGKYSPGGGRITISAEASGREVVISVSDEGLGIAPEEFDKLFERFHRGAVARTRQIAGSGLGLAICKGIIEAHGGRIWAESPVPGRPPEVPPGTVIRFTLPVAAATRTKEGELSQSRMPPAATV